MAEFFTGCRFMHALYPGAFERQSRPLGPRPFGQRSSAAKCESGPVSGCQVGCGHGISAMVAVEEQPVRTATAAIATSTPQIHRLPAAMHPLNGRNGLTLPNSPCVPRRISHGTSREHTTWGAGESRQKSSSGVGSRPMARAAVRARRIVSSASPGRLSRGVTALGRTNQRTTGMPTLAANSAVKTTITSSVPR